MRGENSLFGLLLQTDVQAIGLDKANWASVTKFIFSEKQKNQKVKSRLILAVFFPAGIIGVSFLKKPQNSVYSLAH